MKACIITFQSAYNYGAVLQAFALQNYLNKNYTITDIIDYHNTHIDKTYMKPKWKDFWKNPQNAIFRNLQYQLYKGKNAKIDMFRNKYLQITQRYDEDTIVLADKEADVFISGSDQVWNYLITKRDSSFFLDFARNKVTCSYAASFGISNIPDEYRGFYEEQIKNVKYISVREEQGAKLVQELSGQTVPVMPDPTLLLEYAEWEAMCISPQNIKPYILVYKITKQDKLLKFAKKLSKKTGLTIIYVPNDLKSGIVGKLKLNIGPQEWLGLIKNAEYVVTNSFHGTVFSIIFGRKFFVEISQKVNQSTSRINSLLSMFDLEERTIERYTDDILSKELSINSIMEKINNQKEKAKIFFEQVFNGVIE